MNYPAASYGVSEGRCFAWLSMTRSTKLRVMVREIEPWQTNVMLRLKAEESLFKSAASRGAVHFCDPQGRIKVV